MQIFLAFLLAATFQSGEPIPVGTADRLGPLSPGLSGHPVGWRVDDYNLADGGKLRMEDGSAIGANFIGAGGTGQSKLELFDWDGDGTVDLLVGTPRHHSVPNATGGLPRAAGLPGATVLFLKNVGSNAAPRFRFPVMLRHKGQPILLGQLSGWE